VKQYIQLKDSAKAEHLLKISPHLLQVLAFVSCFCVENDCQLVFSSILSTLEDDQRIGRTSATHREGRAADMSLSPSFGWTEKKIAKLKEELDKTYLHLGAITTSGAPLLCFIHRNAENVGRHAHIQVRPI
jgi:hypothetical protein